MTTALAFDFDGVIMDSEAQKVQAFKSIFSSYPDALEEINVYNMRHRGVPRAVNILYVCESILKLPNADMATHRFLEQYTTALRGHLRKVIPCMGIERFLAATSLPKFVCSSAPQTEIIESLLQHNLSTYFENVFGFPAPKVTALLKLKECYETVVFFGDAVADYEAAVAARVNFVGVESQTDSTRFLELGCPVIQSFADIKVDSVL